MRLWIGLIAGLAIGAQSCAAAELLHPMFQDHAVLQRGRPIPVYGQAQPGDTVTVTLAGSRAKAVAAADGQWRTELPQTPAGGPYTLEARDGDGAEQAIHDVMVGDVFLCSGQSNMQLEVRAAADALAEIRAAHDGEIRMLTVGMHDSATPLIRFADPVAWTVESPQTVGAFSASCFYFARDLKADVHVPIGMVVAAWGGSRARNWVSEGGLRRIGIEDADLDMLDLYRTDPQAAQHRWSQSWQAWWDKSGLAGAYGDPWTVDYRTDTWAAAPEGLGAWALWNGSSPDGFVGQMWLRTTVRLTAEQARQPAVLDLGAVNEEEASWVNGVGLGGVSWSQHSRHPIPPGVLKAGDNSVAVNVFCSWRNCGLSGPPETRAIRFGDATPVLLSAPWRYHALPAEAIAPQLPWGPAHGDSQDYNGMIAPIGAYGFRAAVWYQGESDIHFTPDYQAVLSALMVDWRTQFSADLPFLIVQLPDFGPRATQPTASPFADIREAQRRAVLADPHAGMIVTIDIGDPKTIHPADKQDVGRRLVLAATHLVYGKAAPGSGPSPAQPYHAGSAVMVPFRDVTGALAAYSGAPNAFEMCGLTQASCRYVDAHIIDARTVRLDGGPANASRVRYCWGDSPICTLTDASRLPATPFETIIRK